MRGARATIDDIRRITLPSHKADSGELAVMEGQREVPFAIARVFVVRAFPGAVRGQHAHRECVQFFTCPHGAIDVTCDDGMNTATHRLDQPSSALLIPAGIWSDQRYMTDASVLVVLCDRSYDEADYIRDYEQFTAFRRSRPST